MNGKNGAARGAKDANETQASASDTDGELLRRIETHLAEHGPTRADDLARALDVASKVLHRFANQATDLRRGKARLAGQEIKFTCLNGLFRLDDQVDPAEAAERLLRGALVGPQLATRDVAPMKVMSRFGIAAGRPTAFVGHGGVGKTILAQDLALAVASGDPDCWGVPDLVEASGRVLHLDFEMGKKRTKKRYQRLAFARRLDLTKLGDRLQVVPFPGMKLSDVNFKLALRHILAAAKDADPYVLIVIDSFRAALEDEDENTSAVRKYIDRISELSDEFDVAVVILFHVSKPREGGETPKFAMRGSTALQNAVSSELHMSQEDKTDFVTIRHPKQNEGKKSSEMMLRYVDIGDIETDWMLSQGLRVEQVDATVKAVRQASDESAALEKLIARVVDIVRQHDGQLGSTVLRTMVGGKTSLRDMAIEEAERRGLIWRPEHGAKGSKQRPFRVARPGSSGAVEESAPAAPQSAPTDQVQHADESAPKPAPVGAGCRISESEKTAFETEITGAAPTRPVDASMPSSAPPPPSGVQSAVSEAAGGVEACNRSWLGDGPCDGCGRPIPSCTC